MSTIYKLSFLNDVKPFKTGWRVNVKVLHTWKQYTAQSGESLEIILADEHGVKIHASCKKTYFKKLENMLVVGEWRFIQNFALTTATGLYRSTSHVYKMSFVNNTAITRSTFRSADLFLSLVDFETVLSNTLKTCFLIDVIGEVVDVGEIQTKLCSGKEKKKIEFYLRDINDQRLACCLWGKFAEVVYSASQKGDGEPVICLIRFAKLGSYREELQVSNAFDASQIFIDPETKEAKQLKEMFKKECTDVEIFENPGDKHELQLRRDRWHQYADRSIAEILNVVEAEKCKVVCTIYGIDFDWGWYYFQCKACNKKVIKADPIPNSNVVPKVTIPIWWCEVCQDNVTEVLHKYKFHLLVKDETAETKLMLLDTAANDILGVSAFTLTNGSFEELEDPESFPEEITSLVGKSFKFGICNEKENFLYGLDYYKAMKAWLTNELAMSCSVSLANSDSNNGNTLVSGAEDTLLISNSSYDSNVITTPSSKRSQDDTDQLPDITSTSKKQCTKIIKVEKFTAEELNENKKNK